MFESQETMEHQGEIRLVRGCPCFKVFGDEKLCVNDDEILEIDAIEVHPSLFSFHADREGMKEELAKEDNICYCAIYINYPDNKVYCISQGWKLRIHGEDVPGTDLEDALQFLSTKDQDASAEICSECLYKFLLTLSDIFADMMSKKEKTDEIKRYVDKFSLMIAVKHSQMEGMDPIGTEDDIEEGVDHFAFLREYLVQLIKQQRQWSERANNTEDTEIGKWKKELFELREKLARLEFQFYSQTLQLRDINDFHLLIKMLQYILNSSSEILDLNEEIHTEIRSTRFRELVEYDEQLASLSKYAEKSRTVEHNFGNILQILSRL
ncbi:MAG: hypothetical protein GF411_09600 [Candidatus Lokiarchaeota archaeon]|nr:hypothetical protein [Candidatus Lokiarchaeota archaeon]